MNLRRLAFSATCTLLGVLSVRAAAAHSPAPPARPNILLILADNWRYPHAGALGDPLARTPAFDRVAREGVVVHPHVQPRAVVLAHTLVSAHGQDRPPARRAREPLERVSARYAGHH